MSSIFCSTSPGIKNRPVTATFFPESPATKMGEKQYSTMCASDPMSPRLDVVQVVLRLSSCRTLDEIVQVLRDAARTLAGSDGITIVLRDGNQCFYAEENAVGPLWKGRRFPLSTCISGWCMLHEQQVVIEDIYADARIPHDAYRPTFVKSLAMTPIRKHDPIGAIGAYWATHHTATPEEAQRPSGSGRFRRDGLSKFASHRRTRGRQSPQRRVHFHARP